VIAFSLHQCASFQAQVSEVDRFQAVLQHPAFKANPFATVFEHLENSISSMHAKAAAKAEEKEIRSQSKVFAACTRACSPICRNHVPQALKERTEGKPVQVKASAKLTKQQRKQIENARQMSGAFFAAKRKARFESEPSEATLRLRIFTESRATATTSLLEAAGAKLQVDL
jgi:ABC-type dipeptide/oligopeptide/nickel transport system ATPase subunit